jgi:D-arabinose 1-dehydrogenase-like Zn-dependent alcohol dehydrogenase
MAETKTMKALILESFGTPVVLKEVAIPEPAEGEV